MAGQTILVLDENNTSRIFLATTLRQKGYGTLEASSAREALIFAWRDQPELILFDPVLPDLPPLEFIAKLRHDPRTAQTPLFAMSRNPDPALRAACLQAGVTEFVVKSTVALNALQRSLDRIFHAAPAPAVAAPAPPGPSEPAVQPPPGALIVFLSAKGGTGTSSLCANLAMSLQASEQQARVVVVDLVLPIGSIAQIVGYQGPVNLASVAELPPAETNGAYFHQTLPRPEAWQFQLLAGSPDPQRSSQLKGDRIGELIQVLRRSYDYTILDLGRSLSRISLPLIQQADLIPLVMATDQSTIHLTKTVRDYLKAQGVADQRLFAVLNRAVGLEGLTKNEAEAIIGIPIQLTMPYLASNFTLANNLNQPILTKYPRDTAAIVLKDATLNMRKLVHSLRAG